MLHCADDDVELESNVLTEKLATNLNTDFEQLKLGSVCSSLQLFFFTSVLLNGLMQFLPFYGHCKVNLCYPVKKWSILMYIPFLMASRTLGLEGR